MYLILNEGSYVGFFKNKFVGKSVFYDVFVLIYMYNCIIDIKFDYYISRFF